VRAARNAGATVSVDLNYRAKLRGWGASAGDVMAGIVAEADVLIGNEEDADKVFGIHAPGSAVSDGRGLPRRASQELRERMLKPLVLQRFRRSACGEARRRSFQLDWRRGKTYRRLGFCRLPHRVVAPGAEILGLSLGRCRGRGQHPLVADRRVGRRAARPQDDYGTRDGGDSARLGRRSSARKSRGAMVPTLAEDPGP
jgi:hypothetical protein